MVDVTELDLKFDSKALDDLPAEKQPYHILSWASQIILYVDLHPDFEEVTQTLMITELNDLLSHIEKSKQIPALISKPIRREICKAYQAAYSNSHRRLLFETVNNLVKFISASKADRFSDFKQ